MSKKPTPMCTVPVNHVVISAYDYRILIEDLQRCCVENAELRRDLTARISEIDDLKKELEKDKEDLLTLKHSRDFWYEEHQKTKDALNAIKEAANATPKES